MIFVALGWLATASYLIGHIYLAVKPNYSHRIYYGLNLFGALGFVISSGVIQSWQSVVINIFWTYISFASLQGAGKLPNFPLSRWLLIGPVFIAAAVGGLICAVDVSLGASILGWAGTILYIFGYFLFATDSVKQWQFLSYNTIAALILLPIYGLDENWPAYALSVLWSIISLWGLWNIRNTIRWSL